MSVIIDQLSADMTWARFLRDVQPKQAYGKGFVTRFLSKPDKYGYCHIQELELKQYYFPDGVYRYIGYDEATGWWWK